VSSIRARLLLLLLAMLAVAAAVMGAVAYRTVLAETEALFDYQLRQMALSLRDQGEIAPDQARALGDEQLDFVVQIWTADGRSIYASRAHPELPARALLGLADISAGGQTWRTYSVATNQRVIQVAQPRQIRQRLAADAALRSIAPLAVVAPLLALAMWWLAALTLRPLAEVAAGVRRRDAGSLDALPVAGLPDEVAPLVQALNALLARLGQSLELQRAFVADAAHELRSPLTALKLQMGRLERAADEASRREATEALSQGITRAARLVEQLLALARHEPGAPPLAAQPTDLAEVAREAVAGLVPLALSRGSTISLDAEAPVTMHGDAAALALLVRNLVDNALRHGPAGAAVAVCAERHEGVPRLLVDDAGPGIPADDHARVFDRFYRRAPAGAAGDTDSPIEVTEGSGLGLAIVRGIAEQHDAHINLGTSPLGGLRVEVVFPAAA
jgi:signal transduction histidine kinase